MLLILFVSLFMMLFSLTNLFFFSSTLLNILITFELILLGLNILIVGISFFLDDLMGQIYSLMILTISAAECSIGLALVIVYYRVRGGMSIDIMNLLKS